MLTRLGRSSVLGEDTKTTHTRARYESHRRRTGVINAAGVRATDGMLPGRDNHCRVLALPHLRAVRVIAVRRDACNRTVRHAWRTRHLVDRHRVGGEYAARAHAGVFAAMDGTPLNGSRSSVDRRLVRTSDDCGFYRSSAPRSAANDARDVRVATSRSTSTASVGSGRLGTRPVARAPVSNGDARDRTRGGGKGSGQRFGNPPWRRS